MMSNIATVPRRRRPKEIGEGKSHLNFFLLIFFCYSDVTTISDYTGNLNGKSFSIVFDVFWYCPKSKKKC